MYTNDRSPDDMPKAGDTLQIINSNPRNAVFWRGTDYVRASVDYERFLRIATIPEIEKTFSIKLTRDEKRSDEGNEFYFVG